MLENTLNKATPAQARELLKRITAYIRDHGCHKALTELNNPKGTFGDYANIYTLVVDSTGTLLANARHPDLVGKNIAKQKDADGKLFVEELLESSKKNTDCETVEFRWMNTESKNIGTRTLFGESVNCGNTGRIISCLYYVGGLK